MDPLLEAEKIDETSYEVIYRANGVHVAHVVKDVDGRWLCFFRDRAGGWHDHLLAELTALLVRIGGVE